MLELRDYIARERLDVLALQEPYLWQGTIRGLGMRYVTCGHVDRPRAAVIVCNPLLTVTKLSHFTHRDATAVRLQLGDGEELTVVSFYSVHAQPIGRTCNSWT